jgi:acetyl esterase/lipase
MQSLTHNLPILPTYDSSLSHSASLSRAFTLLLYITPRATKSQNYVGGAPWAAYTAITVFGTLATLPAYLAYYSVPSCRPNPKWTFKQALTNHVVRTVFVYLGETETKTPQITSSKTGDYVELRPLDMKFYRGLLNDVEIQPIPTGAIWVPAAPKDPLKAGQFVTLHMHGGAYVSLSPGTANVQNGPRLLATELGTPVLMLDYRLSCNPRSWFPAALQDAITAYGRLLQIGYTKEQILLSGDSAGGNLVLALLRHITDNDMPELPAPAGAALWSPWVDMSMNNESIENHRNANTDYMTAPLFAWAQREFIPKGRSVDEPYFSPRNHPFKTETRLFIHGGSSEMCIDQIHDVTKKFTGVTGNQVEYMETPHASHDIFATGLDMGFEQQQLEIIAAAHKFLAK